MNHTDTRTPFTSCSLKCSAFSAVLVNWCDCVCDRVNFLVIGQYDQFPMNTDLIGMMHRALSSEINFQNEKEMARCISHCKKEIKVSCEISENCDEIFYKYINKWWTSQALKSHLKTSKAFFLAESNTLNFYMNQTFK